MFLTAFAPDVFGSSGAQADYWGPPSFYWQGTGLYIAQNMGQLYIGAAAALALLWGLFSGAFRDGDGLFLACALAFAILYALGWYTPVFSWMHALLPGVDLYRRPADATFLIGFLASALAAIALDRFLREAGSLRAAPLAATGLIITVAFIAMTVLAIQAGRFWNAAADILLPAALFATAAGLLYALARAQGRLRDMLAAGLALFTVADLAYSNGPGGATALPPAGYDVLSPATKIAVITELTARTKATQSDTRRDRVELAGLGFHWPNAALTHGLESSLGYNPVRLAWVTEALGAGDTVGLPDQRSFSPLFPSYRSPLANLLGLRFIATGVPIEQIDKTLSAGALPIVARTPEATIYENIDALPRVIFAPTAEKADFAEIMRTGRWPRTDFLDTVLIDADPLPGKRAPGTIKTRQLHEHPRRTGNRQPAGRLRRAQRHLAPLVVCHARWRGHSHAAGKCDFPCRDSPAGPSHDCVRIPPHPGCPETTRAPGLIPVYENIILARLALAMMWLHKATLSLAAHGGFSAQCRASLTSHSSRSTSAPSPCSRRRSIWP